MTRKIALLCVAVAAACSGGGGDGGGGGGSADTSAPTIPGSLTVSATSASQIQVTWTASTDDSGVVAYRVYRAGSAYHDTSNLYFTDTGLAAATQYCYMVTAFDAAGNESAQTASMCATTNAAGSYTLSVTKSGSGTGTVTSSPAGISCGATCSASYASGTTVTLTAAPTAGSTFAGWSGACSGTGTCTVTMNTSRSVTATFNLPPTTNYALTVAKAGAGTGTVTSSPAGISCGATCSASYATGTAVTLTATAGSSSSFAGWTNCDVLSLNGSCIMTVNANKTVTATFSGSTTITLPVLAANCTEYNSMDSTYANKVIQSCDPSVGINSWENVWGGMADAWAGLAKFNVSALQGKTIDSATLRLEVAARGVGYWPEDFKVAAVATSWSATSVTWNTMSSFFYYTASWQTFGYPTASGQVYSINLKSTVQSWANGTFANNGLAFLSASYISPGNVTSFDVYEFYIPSLTVTYH